MYCEIITILISGRKVDIEVFCLPTTPLQLKKQSAIDKYLYSQANGLREKLRAENHAESAGVCCPKCNNTMTFKQSGDNTNKCGNCLAVFDRGAE